MDGTPSFLPTRGNQSVSTFSSPTPYTGRMFGLLLFDFFLSLNLRPSYPPLYPPDMTSFPTAIVHGESIDLNETNGHQGREGETGGRPKRKREQKIN